MEKFLVFSEKTRKQFYFQKLNILYIKKLYKTRLSFFFLLYHFIGLKFLDFFEKNQPSVNEGDWRNFLCSMAFNFNYISFEISNILENCRSFTF